MTLASNDLSHRAETVRQLVAESDAAAVTSVEKALAAGHELVAAKTDCKHGEWLPFLERACVPERRAQRYMKLAESGLKSDTVSDLGGVRGALEFLALKKKADAAFDDALASFAVGGFGIDGLERALAAMDDIVELFPEEKRGPLRRFQPEQDAEIAAARLADILEAA